MLISIITATFNSSATVSDTLNSVRSQDYEYIEHLIIDGFSTDNTLNIVQQYPQVAKVVSEKDGGIYDAMNKGIAIATGGIVGILNSDDVYYNNEVIGKVMKAFEDRSVDAVYGDLQYVRQDDLSKVTRMWHSGSFGKRKFYFGWMPPHPAFFVRRKVYEEIGDFNLSLRSAADYEFMLRALFKNNYKPYYIPETLVKMRTGGMSNATLKHRLRANAEDRKAWEINGLRPFVFTIPLKPLRKIFQFINR
ncbi:MAG: glycosyltransferase [Chitinophagaceae bacterium]|nr:glycosyltransferase [Chitinophagaceae bacterium]